MIHTPTDRVPYFTWMSLKLCFIVLKASLLVIYFINLINNETKTNNLML